jgi:hypothetical protein
VTPCAYACPHSTQSAPVLLALVSVVALAGLTVISDIIAIHSSLSPPPAPVPAAAAAAAPVPAAAAVAPTMSWLKREATWTRSSTAPVIHGHIHSGTHTAVSNHQWMPT